MKKQHIGLILAFIMIISAILPVVALGAPTIERVSGSNRYETAIAVSKREFNTSETAILASGENFADALAGGQLSVILPAPILLTTANKLDDNVKAELTRLNINKVYILGGYNTIKQAVEDEVKKICEVERLYGSDRFETSKKIIEKARSLGITKNTVFADGLGFPDALAAGTIVSARNYSLSLSPKEKLPVIETNKQLVLGGKNSLPLPEYNGERIAGTNRYQTALLLAEYTYPGAEFTSETIVLVDGTNYPDALSAISIANANSAPILLTNPKSLDPETEYFIRERVSKVIIVGGKNSVSEEVEKILKDDSVENSITITKQPKVGFAEVGKYVELNVEAQGNGLTYQWQQKVVTSWTPNVVTEFVDIKDDGDNFIGANTANLKVKIISRDVLLNNRLEQDYRCYVKDESGNGVYTNMVRVYPNNEIDYNITENLDPWEGEKVELTVDAWGDSPIVYEWEYKKNGEWLSIPADSVIYTGANTNKLSFVALEELTYDYRCVLRSPNAQDIETKAVRVTVYPLPAEQAEHNASQYISVDLFRKIIKSVELWNKDIVGIEGPNDAVGIVQGYGATFNVKVNHSSSSPPNIKYQWQFKKHPWNTWKDIDFVESNEPTLAFRITKGSEHNRVRCKIIVNNGEPIFSKEAIIKQKLKFRGPESRTFNVKFDKVKEIKLDVTGDSLVYKWTKDKAGLNEITSHSDIKIKDGKRSGFAIFIDDDTILIHSVWYYLRNDAPEYIKTIYCHITDKYGDKVVAGPYNFNYLNYPDSQMVGD